MTIVVITEDKVHTFKKWSDMKKVLSFEKEEFAEVGTDYVLNCTNDTYTMALDIKQLETVASQKVFTKDKFDLTNWLQLFTLILVFIFR